jgi:Domain of Unknown Function (DUF928)
MKMKLMNSTNRRITTALLCGFAFGALSVTSLAAQAPGQPAPPKRVHAKLDGFDVSPNAGKSGTQIGGASRGLGPKLYAPNGGKSYTTQPVFHWTSGDTGKVTFRLLTSDGTAVYETTTSDDHLKYPADAPALTPGTSYMWTIRPENDILGGAPKPVTIMILGGADRDAIAKELASASGPAAAQVYVNHHLWYDAIDSYSTMLTQNPDDQNARQMRAKIYAGVPATEPLADVDWNMVH